VKTKSVKYEQQRHKNKPVFGDHFAVATKSPAVLFYGNCVIFPVHIPAGPGTDSDETEGSLERAMLLPRGVGLWSPGVLKFLSWTPEPKASLSTWGPNKNTVFGSPAFFRPEPWSSKPLWDHVFWGSPEVDCRATKGPLT